VLEIAAILARGHSQQLTKYSRHMRVARKSAKGGDIDERGGPFSHELLCALQPKLQQIRVWREPDRSLEHSQKVAPAVSALRCQCSQIQVSNKVLHALKYTLQKVTRQRR
jgi:hypothetical protein